jgi:transcriptional regulator with XRE-family HTH domain
MTHAADRADAGTPPLGHLLREWRRRRRLTQLDLANVAGVSTRHLSFVETGRSQPSREMVLHLAEHLGLPLRERNRLLLAAGYAPVYDETELDSPRLSAVRSAVRHVLRGHEPYPALVVDRYWDIVDATDGLALLTAGVAPELLEPPVNVLRVALHPEGLVRRVLNAAQWREHLLARLRQQVDLSADARLEALLREVRGYPAPDGVTVAGSRPGDPAVPLLLRHEGRVLAFVSTVTMFGTPLDVTVSELVVEAFYPADDATAAALAR